MATARRLHFDLETRGVIDLRKTNVYVYALDPRTQIILASWRIDAGPIRTWHVLSEPPPAELIEVITDPTTIFVAHNSGFERIMMSLAASRQSTVPAAIIAAMRVRERWDCTAARSAALGLPRALENSAKALRLAVQKDLEGKKLMLLMCKPRAMDSQGLPVWHERPDQIARLAAYCEIDVATESAIDDAIPELSPTEREYWLLIEKMNDRGAPVDEELVKRMMLLVDEAEVALNRRLKFVTQDAVPKVTSTKKIAEWLQARGLKKALEDVEKFSVGKAAVNAWLADADLDPTVREVLTLRQNGGKSSTSKYRGILDRLNADGRLRGALTYCGAAATGRLSSRGAALQNMAANRKLKDVRGAITAIKEDWPISAIEDVFDCPFLVTASELLRPSFEAPEGYWIVRGDYSQIEMRTNSWVCDDQESLEAFRAYDRKEGPDAYIIAAGLITGRDPSTISKDDIERQWGKVLELACGFAGGKGALLAMAKLYNIMLTVIEADNLVMKWRAGRPCLTGTWVALENAAMLAMTSPLGSRFEIGKHLSVRRSNQALAMKLPSGRSLMYWWPEIKNYQMPWLDRNGEPVFKDLPSYMAEDSQTTQWQRFALNRMILIENPVQAIARDIMMYALLALENAGFQPFLSVHDEAVCLLPKSKYPLAKDAALAVKAIMEKLPSWAAGLPIAADASADDRYLKG